MLIGGPPLSSGNTIVTQASDLGPMVRAMRSAQVRGLDFETSGLRFWDGQQPIGFACGYLDTSTPTPRAWYVPVGHRTAERQCPAGPARAAFRDIFGVTEHATNPFEIVGHNLGFDLNMGRGFGWEIAPWATIHDSLIQGVLINENRSLKLENIVGDLGVSPYQGGAHAASDQLDSFLKSRARAWGLPLKKSQKNPDPNASYLGRFGHAEVPVALEGEYSCRDIGHTLLLDWHQRNAARAVGTPWEDRRRVLYDNEMLLVRAIADMVWNGQIVNVEHLLKLGRDLGDYLEREGATLTALFGTRINWGNDNQVRDLLYTRLELPVLSTTPKGLPSVDRSALMALRSLHAGIEPLGEWRSHYKVQTTYTDTLAAKVGPGGRIHADFVQWGAGTGRLSARNPNLQNIPARHPTLSKRVRQAFVVDPGKVRVLCDYSQIELRVLGWTTGCATFVNAYESPAYMALLRGDIDYDTYRVARRAEATVDIHGEGAKATFGVTDLTTPAGKRARSAQKIINFGVPYGGGPGLLQGDPNLRLSKKDAERYFEAYHRKNPEITHAKRALFHKMYQQRDGEAGPYFINWAGRMRHGPRLLWNRRKGAECPVAEEERSMFASLIQGGAAELTKFSLVRLWLAQQRGDIPGKTVTTVHDEIGIDGDEAATREIALTTQRVMEDFGGLFGTIPVIADLETTTTNWADKAEYNPWSTA